MQKPTMLFVVLISILLGVYGQLSAEESAVPWNDNQINALFPAPLAGWSAGDVDVSKSEDMMAELDSFVDDISGLGGKLSTCYLASRKYQNKSLQIVIQIKTLDTAMAGAITRTHDDTRFRAAMADDGAVPTTVGGHRALSISDKEDGKGLFIKVSSAGTLSIMCSELSRSDAVARYLERIDLQRIVDFAESAQ